MADYAKVDRNLGRLYSQNASDDDISQYLAEEGVTPDDMAKYRDSQILGGVPARAVGAINSAIVSGIGAVKGKQDPANKDLPTVYDQYADGMGFRASKHGQYDLTSPVATAAMGGASDAAMADVMQQNLGDRFVRREKDANDYDIIVSKDADGNEQRGYVNKPGLDKEDLWRTFYGASPYVASGVGIGAMTRGLSGLGGVATRGVAQGAGAGATSGAGDVAAAAVGSEQGLDLPKMGLSAAFGLGAEVALPAGTALFRGLRGPRGNLTNDGLLTDNAKAAAKSVGLDFDDLSKAEQRLFASGLNKGSDPREIASLIETNRFGIQTTKATRTGDPELSLLEKDIRYGTQGLPAKQHLDEFYKNQQQQIEQSALSRPYTDENTILSRVQGEAADPYRDGMGSFLAPTRTATSAEDVAPGILGDSIKGNLSAMKSYGDDAIKEAYKPITDTTPKPAAFATLPQHLQKELGEYRINSSTMPTAHSILKDLEGFAKGRALSNDSATDWLGQAQVTTLLEKQKQLSGMVQGAQSNTDRVAAKRLYDGFNNWIDDIADQGLVNGEASAASAIREARTITADIKRVFDPKGRGVNPAASSIMKQLVEEENNADSVVSILFGSGLADPKPGSIDALRSIKRGLFSPVGGRRLVDPLMAKRTWNDIRMAYWSKLVTDKTGKMLQPGYMARNLSIARTKQYGVMDTLFTPNEMRVIRQYEKAIGQTIFRDPNASGTSTALRSLGKNDGSFLKTLLEAQSQRELFSKHNVFMSRFYRMLANKVPVDFLGLKEFAGLRAAKRTTAQSFTRKPYKSYGAAGAAYGGAVQAPLEQD